MNVSKAAAKLGSRKASVFTWLWVAWALAFGVIEGEALINRVSDDTLSEKLRDLFHTRTKAGRSVWAIVFGIFTGLFALHIAGSNLTFWGSSKEK